MHQEPAVNEFEVYVKFVVHGHDSYDHSRFTGFLGSATTKSGNEVESTFLKRSKSTKR